MTNSRVLGAIVLVLGICTVARAELFLANLNGLQENPANASPGIGSASASYDPNTQLLTVNMSYSGLTVAATDSHIHCCSTALTTNASVAIPFIPAGFVTGATSGNFNAVLDLSLASTYTAGYITASGGTVDLARDRLLNAMRFGVENDPLPGDSSIAYFNIHTSNFPGGEIRGNIFPDPIPEPSTVLLLLCGIAPVALARRR